MYRRNVYARHRRRLYSEDRVASGISRIPGAPTGGMHIPGGRMVAIGVSKRLTYGLIRSDLVDLLRLGHYRL